jgi:hypothetical protein
MDGLRVVLRKLDPAIVKQKTCDVCHRTENDELSYGKLHSLDDITAHYYCLVSFVIFYFEIMQFGY